MTLSLVLTVGLLAVPAVLPMVAIAGIRPATLFSLPLAGAALIGIAATLELALGGALLVWYVLLSIAANLGAVAIFVHRGAAVPPGDETSFRLVQPTPSRRRGASREEARAGRLWVALPVVLAIAAVIAWPLQVLRFPVIGYDTWAIWSLHSMFVFGGHQELLSALRNSSYVLSNQDYPPLVAGVGALGFVVRGQVDIRLAADLTALLTGSAVGVIGCGVAEAVDPTGALRRLGALAAAMLLCLIAFGTAAVSAVNGYADLLWAAAAVSACIFGLVLPRSRGNLGIAWVGVVVASLAKNEGLALAVLICVLVSLRYIPSAEWRRWLDLSPRLRESRLCRLFYVNSVGSFWVSRIGLVCIMLIPGLAWAALVRLDGIGDRFFGQGSPESLTYRFHISWTYLSQNLHILPVAIAVLVAGSLSLGHTRKRLGLGHPLWLWVALAGSLLEVLFTYVFGGYEIFWWMITSANRTTIFIQLAAYSDLALWLLLAISDRKLPSREGKSRSGLGGSIPKGSASRHRHGSTRLAPTPSADSQPASTWMSSGEL